MSNQPKALRLADALYNELESYGDQAQERLACESAAELRRLHEQNQELLEALRDVINTLTDGPDESDVARVFKVARAAIAKATEPRVNT